MTQANESPNDVAAIVQGGCASGAMMEDKTMSSDVLQQFAIVRLVDDKGRVWYRGPYSNALEHLAHAAEQGHYWHIEP